MPAHRSTATARSTSMALPLDPSSSAGPSASPDPPDVPFEFRKKDGTPSKMRSHRGNIPVLPQTKLCPHCPAKFTRTTHLNRHLRTHTNERLHKCETCTAEFTRSDLLTRHKRSCNDPNNPGRSRKKSCQPCSDSKIKCDNRFPCTKCTSRGKECVFLPPNKRSSLQASSNDLLQSMPPAPPTTSSLSIDSPTSPVSACSTSLPTPTSLFIATPEQSHATFSMNTAPHIAGVDDMFPDLTSAATSLDTYSPPHQLRYPSPDKPPGPSRSPDLMSSDSATDHDTWYNPVNSHLNTVYQSDMFEPFFSNIFSQSRFRSHSPPGSAGGVLGDFPFSIGHEPQGFSYINPTDTQLPIDFGMMTNLPGAYSGLDDTNSVAELPEGDASSSGVAYPGIDELNLFLYIFFSSFSSQLPIIHPSTFKVAGKPPVLLSAIQACGALFVKTKQATDFISSVLATARDDLIQEFAKNPTNCDDQIDLILAVVLLQTIGLFHQRLDQRASSSIYHGMLVMMIRRSNLMNKNTSWIPPSFSESSLEDVWRQWALHEMTKRALLISYIHDCSHSIYFALPPSYLPGEVELYLPCEDALWRATSAKEWLMVLQSSSPYGDPTARLIGYSMPKALSLMCEPRIQPTPIILNPFAHFILVHVILYHVFTICMENRLPKSDVPDFADDSLRVKRLQFGLHNWLQSWLASPDSPRKEGTNEEPPFFSYGLPFYWLGQVALLAYQEGLPPFEFESPNNLVVESRFRIVKQWLRHIRGFLKKSDNGPTLLWDELMKIRLDTSWPGAVEGDTGEEDGLLSFFPSQ